MSSWVDLFHLLLYYSHLHPTINNLPKSEFHHAYVLQNICNCSICCSIKFRNNVIWVFSCPPSSVIILTYDPVLLCTNTWFKSLPSMCSKNIFLLHASHSEWRTDFILKCAKHRTVFITPSLNLWAMLLAGANVRTYDCNVGSFRHYLRQVVRGHRGSKI